MDKIARSCGRWFSAETGRKGFRLAVRRSRATPWFAVLASFLLCACTGLPALDAIPEAPRFGETFGLGVKFSQGEPETDLAMLPELGVHWVRDILEWADIEPTPGEFVEFSPSVLRRLRFYRDHDIGVVALLSLENVRAYPAESAHSGVSSDAGAFGRYAAWCARQLQDLGVRFVIELGNEPHNSVLPGIFGGTWNGHPPAPWLDHYVRMVGAAVEEVKGALPNTVLLTDDDMWIVHYWFLEAGLPGDLDGFAVHPYSKTPEETAVGPDTDWTRPFTVVDADRSFGSAVRRLKRRGTEKLGRPPEIWVTEWGWPVDNDASNSVPESEQADFLPRAFVLSAAAGIKTLCWFSAQDSVDGPMGLQDNSGRRRASYLAFKTMNAQLGGSRLLGRLKVPGVPASVYVFVFADDRERRLIAWDSSGKTMQLALPADETDSVVGTLGEPVAFERVPGGSSRLALGAAPVYVSGRWSDRQLQTALRSLGDGQVGGR